MNKSELFNNNLFKRFATGLLVGLCFLGSYIHSQLLFSFVLLFILVEVLVFEWPKLCATSCKAFCRFLTFAYPVFPIFILFYFHLMFYQTDYLFPLYIFLVSWTGDTAAFIVGKLFGKHKIVPSISPKKSWEGLAAGCVGTLIFNVLYLPAVKISPFPMIVSELWIVALFSIVITVIGFIGDIFVSFLKRKKELKDTGHLLPGHGGILDRFDSVFFVAIFIFILILLF